MPNGHPVKRLNPKIGLVTGGYQVGKKEKCSLANLMAAITCFGSLNHEADAGKDWTARQIY